jgi:hypothetical protein
LSPAPGLDAPPATLEGGALRADAACNARSERLFAEFVRYARETEEPLDDELAMLVVDTFIQLEIARLFEQRALQLSSRELPITSEIAQSAMQSAQAAALVSTLAASLLGPYMLLSPADARAPFLLQALSTQESPCAGSWDDVARAMGYPGESEIAGLASGRCFTPSIQRRPQWT